MWGKKKPNAIRHATHCVLCVLPNACALPGALVFLFICFSLRKNKKVLSAFCMYKKRAPGQNCAAATTAAVAAVAVASVFVQ